MLITPFILTALISSSCWQTCWQRSRGSRGSRCRSPFYYFVMCVWSQPTIAGDTVSWDVSPCGRVTWVQDKLREITCLMRIIQSSDWEGQPPPCTHVTWHTGRWTCQFRWSGPWVTLVGLVWLPQQQPGLSWHCAKWWLVICEATECSLWPIL